MKQEKSSNVIFDANKMLLSNKSPFSVQEAYKTLRTNVTFSLPGTDCKCVGVVSADRGDGKSTIAVNLTVSLAQINKRVILIDCDLRLPTIAQKLGIKSTPGISNYLSGDVTEIPVIHDYTRGFDVIPSGNLPPDSTTLISSDEMLELIQKLKEEYDYIIFDFPPINIVSDAALLSDVIDGYLIVVRHENSEYKMVDEAIHKLLFTDGKIIGFVYNGKNNKKSYYKKGKGYYYNKYYYRKNP